MDTTILLCKIIGPVLILRGVSLLVAPKHFRAMLAGLDREVETISFSLVPVALLMAGLALVNTLTDTSSVAGILLLAMAWGAILKSSLLIVFPRLIVAKAQLAGRAGFLYVVCAVCLAVGAYFCWVGYLAGR